MGDIHQTTTRYETVCQEQGQKPNEYIIAMLERDKKASERQARDAMNLYLAGNDGTFDEVVRLSDDDALILSKTLCNNMYVTSLDLRYNHITDTGAAHIAQLIKETACLQQLNLMGNDIGPEGAKLIAKALHSNETLMSLKLTGNKIGNTGGMALAAMLQVNTSLTALDVSDTDQETQSLIALSTVLNYNNTLRYLNIGRPQLFSQQEETTVHYARLLKISKGLKGLHMAKHTMRDFGVTRISENLMDNFTLLHLDLSCNRITRDGALALAELLKRDTSLKVLDLSHNRLGDAGAHSLAQAIATYNTHLNVLVVSHNEMNGKGLCSLAQALHLNSTLSNLYVWGNKLEEAACLAFSKLLDSGRLETKNTDVEPYVVDGTTYLSELNHGIRRHYFLGPYGDYEQKDIIVT